MLSRWVVNEKKRVEKVRVTFSVKKGPGERTRGHGQRCGHCRGPRGRVGERVLDTRWHRLCRAPTETCPWGPGVTNYPETRRGRRGTGKTPHYAPFQIGNFRFCACYCHDGRNTSANFNKNVDSVILVSPPLSVSLSPPPPPLCTFPRLFL